jgi:hypothetical protein
MDVKEKVEFWCTQGKPYPFKDELKIYPVLLKDYYSFAQNYPILVIDKNSVPDVNIIQMSYLDYLLGVLVGDETGIGKTEYTVGNMFSHRLVSLLYICFRLQDFEDEEKRIIRTERLENGHYNLLIGATRIDSKEFDEFIKVVSFQNIYDYSDDYINPDVKKAMDEYYAIKNKDLDLPTLEKKQRVVTLLTGIQQKDLLEMTYREFEGVFQLGIARQNYELGKQCEFQGGQFDKPISHWVYGKKDSRYADAFTSYDGFKNKIETF